ncbi:MAG: glycosyltransferase [Pseudanabaenaceae cyanobacterium]
MVPIYSTQSKGEGILQCTLKSVEASINYYLEHEKPEYYCQYEVILINDASTDGTWEVVKQFVKGKSFY